MMEYLESVQEFLTPESANEALRNAISTVAGVVVAWVWKHVAATFRKKEQALGEICKSVVEMLNTCETMNPLPVENKTDHTLSFSDIRIEVSGNDGSGPGSTGRLLSVMIGARDAYPHLNKTERAAIQTAYHNAVRRLRELKAKREQAAILHSLTSLEKKNK